MLGSKGGGETLASTALESESRLLGGFLEGRLGLIADVLGPGISGGCPGAVMLNSEVVGSSDQSECAIFAPVAAPRVTDYPVFDSIFFSPSSD